MYIFPGQNCVCRGYDLGIPELIKVRITDRQLVETLTALLFSVYIRMVITCIYKSF